MKDGAFDKLAQEIKDDDLTTFTFRQAQEWAEELGFSAERPSSVIDALKKRGLTMVERQPPRNVRTIGSNPHDRWSGPGACRSHGGGGGSSINGMAGREG